LERVLTGDTQIKQWKQANLLFPSLVTGIIQTVKGQMIERKLGTLAEEDFQNVRQALKISLGF
jgi:hypothetical protein